MNDSHDTELDGSQLDGSQRDASQSDASQSDDFPEQVKVRRDKRDRIIAEGGEAYPVSVPRTTSLQQVREAYAHLGAGEETTDVVGITGRVVFLRGTGKLAFATLQEGDGTRLQVMVSRDGAGEGALAAWKTDVDLGDFVFVHGNVISSKRGELSVFADSWAMASKSLRPLPVLHKELSEETRVRQRYVDLIVRDAARENVRARSVVVRSVRHSLEELDFLEVETPMLQTLHGGASARPFVTHSNAFDTDLYLRIAPELFLKRCVVGGIERVFEINRNFRNEGADSTHSPEFAMLETYQAWGDYDSIGDLTRTLVQNAAQAAFGTHAVTLADGSEYDFGGTWDSLSMYPSLSESLGTEITPATSRDHLISIAQRLGISVDPVRWTHGKLVEELWEHQVSDSLYSPTFVRDFPVETSPLVRSHRSVEGVVEKWDLYVRGFELATGYSELVDPVVQRQRFVEQARLGALGDDEAMRIDEDFLRAQEHGMPPTGGMG
ncbi:MAG: lysine--tRNA ligase, partial [Janthinobacterium lividum]